MSADDIRYLVLHCSATRCDQDYTVEQMRRDHKARHFRGIGYQFYVSSHFSTVKTFKSHYFMTF